MRLSALPLAAVAMSTAVASIEAQRSAPWLEAGGGIGGTLGGGSVYRTSSSALAYVDLEFPSSGRVGLGLGASYANELETVTYVCLHGLGDGCGAASDRVRFAGIALLAVAGPPIGPSRAIWSASLGPGIYRITDADRTSIGVQGSVQRALIRTTGVAFVGGIRGVALPSGHGTALTAFYLTLGFRFW